ncbi:MAG: HAD-IA family hydrolase [Chloroflexi bacterium]|nr:HAD-IA family hydrolase [Chloroflexota bacterium]
MIKAVFFDWYNTIARFYPPREEQQVAACRQLGVEVSPQALRRAYPAADDFMTRENAFFALRERPELEQQRFWAEYERMLLREAGVEVSAELALQIIQEVRLHPSEFALFEDALPTLQEVKARGLVLGLLSNLRRELDELCQRLGLTPYLDFTLTSAEVGFEKPHPAIFFEALKRANVKPAQALHVGDQYHSDILGARGVGIRPLLLDRDGSWEEVKDCPRIKTLAEVLNYL